MIAAVRCSYIQSIDNKCSNAALSTLNPQTINTYGISINKNF